MARPLLVLVSGHPGSGKTTLGRALGDAMVLPHLNRDAMRAGLTFTEPSTPPDPELVWRTYLDTIERWLVNGISLVTDQTLYIGMTDELRSRLPPLGDVVNIHCRCPHAYERWVAKTNMYPQFSEVDARVRAQRDEFTDPLPLGVPVIEVETSDGYDPPLDELARLIADSRS